MAFADFCAVTPDVAAGRAARRTVSRCRFLRSGRAARPGAWFLVSRRNHPGLAHDTARRTRCVLTLQAAPGQWPAPSPGTNSPPDCLRPGSAPCKNANCRCTSAAFTVEAAPVGFAVMCQLASAAWALYAVSVHRLAPLALGLPSDKPSRACPCRWLVVILAHDESKSVLPQGTSTL
jgi:hypothetical protein